MTAGERIIRRDDWALTQAEHTALMAARTRPITQDPMHTGNPLDTTPDNPSLVDTYITRWAREHGQDNT